MFVDTKFVDKTKLMELVLTATTACQISSPKSMLFGRFSQIFIISVKCHKNFIKLILNIFNVQNFLQVVISALGVAGNILNLMTLRSPSLRNVPFMFIRALALFDLVKLFKF